MREGVRDFSISRANVQWGIPLPWDPSQTVYVWFDALNGYLRRADWWALAPPENHLFPPTHHIHPHLFIHDPIPSPTLNPTPPPHPLNTPTPLPHPSPSALFAGAESEASADQALTRGWPANTHVIGKDILRFHAVYWPGMLMSAGMPLPGSVYGHGFLTKVTHGAVGSGC